ncbi:MAG: right-handed parallel beta-helix repeat-containing protein [Candidatus Zophobacter franzmannii]|nr:right-handed parallel beta-helix repeat-containing protein [Candidatus Zophobacter franzmannii]
MLITGDVYIDIDITLTINAGVTVSFLKIDVANDGFGDVDFFNNGQLLISGTEADPVIFTSWEENPQAGDWYGVTHSNTASVYSSADHLIVRYATKGLTVDGKYITLEDVIVEECYSEGIFVDDSWSGQTSLTNVVLQNNGTDGLSIAANGIVQANNLFSANNDESGVKIVSNSNTTLQNSRIISKLESGVDALNSSFTLTNCSISFNDVDGLLVEASSTGSVITVLDCSINDNGIFGVHLNGPIDGIVDGCDITGNGNAGVIMLGEAFVTVNICNIMGNGVNPQSYTVIEQVPTNQLYSTGSYSGFYTTMLPLNLITRLHASGYADHDGSSDDYYFYAYDTSGTSIWSYTRTKSK